MIYSLNLKNIDLGVDCVDLTNKNELSSIPKDVEGVIIRWFGEAQNKNNFINQAVLVNYCVKNKKPIFLIDRDSKIKKKEFDWIERNTKSCFTEPYIISRHGFMFLPEPLITKYDEKEAFKNVYKPVRLVYDGSLKGIEKEFRDTYVETAYDKRVKILINDENYEPVSSNEEKTIIRNESIDDVEPIYIAIDNKKNYRNGRIDPVVFDYMKQGHMVLLPKKHRFYILMFYDLILERLSLFSLEKLAELKGPFISDIFHKWMLYYPEFYSEYGKALIKEFFKGE